MDDYSGGFDIGRVEAPEAAEAGEFTETCQVDGGVLTRRNVAGLSIAKMR